MIPLFLGLTAANLICLTVVFFLGLFVEDATGGRSDLYTYHITLAIGAGLMTALCHVAVFTYFMATTKWLGAATDKAGLDPAVFVQPPARRKSRAFAVAMLAVVVTMLTMFLGAAADTIAAMPGGVHLASGIAALLVNLACATAEYRLIKQQGALMDDALAAVNGAGLSVASA